MDSPKAEATAWVSVYVVGDPGVAQGVYALRVSKWRPASRRWPVAGDGRDIPARTGSVQSTDGRRMSLAMTEL